MDESLQTRSGRAKFSDDESDLSLIARITHGDRDALREEILRQDF